MNRTFSLTSDPPTLYSSCLSSWGWSGYSKQQVSDCFRFNKNGVDLNRNFPDAFAGLRGKQQLDVEKRELEVGRLRLGPLMGAVYSLSPELFLLIPMETDDLVFKGHIW